MAATAARAAVLDFTNTKDGVEFNKKRVPAGDYLAKVTRVVDAPTKDTKEAQWLYTIVLVGQFSDRKFPYYCKLTETQLWKVRNLFLAAGITVPKKKIKVDPNKVVGKTIAVTLEDDEYDGKLQSTIAQIFPATELDSTESDDADEPDEDEEEEDQEETEDEDTEEEEDGEEDEEEEEEEEPAPAPKKAAARIPAQRKASPAPAKKAAAGARRKAAPVADEELEELDIEDL